MPPDAVPVYLSPVITRYMNCYFYDVVSPPLAFRAASAEHTHKADELDTPAAKGTLP